MREARAETASRAGYVTSSPQGESKLGERGMLEYRVGTLYNQNKIHWNQHIEYSYRANTHELRMFLSRLSEQEIEKIRSGPCKFVFVKEEDVLFFCSDFGLKSLSHSQRRFHGHRTRHPSDWSDSPYSIHMIPKDERTEPPKLAPGEQALLHIVLVSAEDGIIRAFRKIRLKHDFSVALHKAIRAQARKPFNQASYDKQLEQNYQNYPTTFELLRRATKGCFIGSDFTSEHDDYSLVMEYMQKTLPTFTPSREDIPFCMMYPDSDGYCLEGTGNIEDRSGGGSYEIELCVMIYKMYKDVFITRLERQPEPEQELEQTPKSELEL